ncbi:helix-turn-helix domain-containing protein [Aquimarina sp. 2201CG14-23]|uniref:helix-turn-helix domain-containing protein n=1 Tax=Aquimarina mycalae TaxID=3040073 RepID=UPI002477F107|nr:helix-turn-helix domain-containing protein [Aquimarina sp. 2201CG14-23]MDH7447467.1 helix-turn-helix domain-containing protein [Aquimarina sp. 2201CG14-23]
MTKQFLATCFLIPLLFFGKSAFAIGVKPNNQDSLTTKSPKQLIEYIQHSTLEESKIYEIALNKISDSDLILAQQHYSIALFFYKKEEYERSVYYLNKTAKLAKKIEDDTFLSKCYIKLGNAYLKDWKNQKSLDSYDLALKILQKNKNIKYELAVNSGMAMILRRMQQLDKALEVCKNALLLIENSSYKNSIDHVNFITIISETYLDQKKYDSVLHYADIGIAMSKPLDYSIGHIDLLTKKGIVAFNRNKLPQALHHLYLAEDILINKKITQKNSILNLYYFLASCFYEQKEYNKAISYLKNTESLLEEKDSRNIRFIDINKLFAKCYKVIDKKQESIYLEKVVALQAQLQDATNKTVTKLHKQDTQKLENTLKARYKEYVFFILLFVCAFLMFILFKYFRKQKNNKVHFDTLIQKINALESKEKNHTKIQTVVINDEKVNDVLNGLHKLETQEFFLNTDCDLRSMSKKVKTNTTYLSKIIKTHKAESFNDYINDLRIEYALKRLKNDKKFRSFSVKSIALEIGYKTDNSFTKHFKSKTGINPSYYIKKINSNKIDN